MVPVKEAAAEFLAKKRIAVTGGVPHTQRSRQQRRL